MHAIHTHAHRHTHMLIQAHMLTHTCIRVFSDCLPCFSLMYRASPQIVENYFTAAGITVFLSTACKYSVFINTETVCRCLLKVSFVGVLSKGIVSLQIISILNIGSSYVYLSTAISFHVIISMCLCYPGFQQGPNCFSHDHQIYNLACIPCQIVLPECQHPLFHWTHQ